MPASRGSHGGMDPGRASDEDLTTLRAVFQRGLPLGWEEVHAFEAEQGVVLPEPYRTFVAEICNGSSLGPPSYGLMPLSLLPEGPYRRVRDLAGAFPLTEPWPWEGERRSYEELEPLLDPVYNQGSIVLGTDGCGMYWHLIVAGAHRGHVWNICDVGAQPFGAEFGCTTGQAGFAGWVRHWAGGKWWWDAALTAQRARQPAGRSCRVASGSASEDARAIAAR